MGTEKEKKTGTSRLASSLSASSHIKTTAPIAIYDKRRIFNPTCGNKIFSSWKRGESWKWSEEMAYFESSLPQRHRRGLFLFHGLVRSIPSEFVPFHSADILYKFLCYFYIYYFFIICLLFPFVKVSKFRVGPKQKNPLFWIFLFSTLVKTGKSQSVTVKKQKKSPNLQVWDGWEGCFLVDF